MADDGEIERLEAKIYALVHALEEHVQRIDDRLSGDVFDLRRSVEALDSEIEGAWRRRLYR